MKIINLEELNIEVQLIGSSAYLYSESSSDIIYIDDIKYKENAKELIIKEIEVLLLVSWVLISTMSLIVLLSAKGNVK